MFKTAICLRCLLLLLPLALASGAEPPSDALLRRADQARGNLDGVRWTVALESHSGNRTSERTYEVTARHFDFLAVAVAPERLQGNRLLMKQGNMWFFKPDLSRPVPVARRQKLAGGAAYGDIAATNYAEDYNVTAEGDGTWNERRCRILHLEGKTRNVTYDKITYWIDIERGVGIRAEYYTVSGKKLKSATMEYDNTLGDDKESAQLFISAMTIRDELAGSDYTVMTFSKPSLTAVLDRDLDLQGGGQ